MGILTTGVTLMMVVGNTVPDSFSGLALIRDMSLSYHGYILYLCYFFTVYKDYPRLLYSSVFGFMFVTLFT